MFRLVTWLGLGWFAAAAALGQGVITTFAGTDWVFPGNGKAALDAPLGNLGEITTDPAGNPVFVDTGNCMVARINADGTLTVIAGNGICLNTGEGGPAISAGLELPVDVTYDRQGNLYILGTLQIKKVAPDGTLKTLAGVGPRNAFFSGDGGPATLANFSSMGGIVVDGAGDIIFADSSNNRIRKIAPNGIISTIAGNGSPTFSGDGGQATAASLGQPRGVALDSAGNLYIADTFNNRIRKVTPDGTISTVVQDLFLPVRVVFDQKDVLYIADYFKIYQLAPGKSITTIASPTGPSSSTGLSVAVNGSGTLFLADGNNSRVSRIGADGTVTRLAGNGRFKYGGEQTPALATTLAMSQFAQLAVDPAGNVFVSEDGGNRVRKIAAGVVTTYGGTGDPNDNGDGGAATQAGVNMPQGLTFDSAGNLVVTGIFKIRKITPGGVISTFVKTPADCPYILPDGVGNLYVSCTDNFVRRIDSGGNFTVVAGNGTPAYSGDGGPATAAGMVPAGMAFDRDGGLLIADSANDRIRKVNQQGVISTIAGTGVHVSAGDGGLAMKASLILPQALLMDGSGNLFIGEFKRVRKIAPNGFISTFAGGGPDGALGDGKVATAASLSRPFGLAMDAAGNLYIAENGTGRIREVLATPPTVQVPQTSLAFTAASGGAAVTQTIPVLGSVAGLEFRVSVATQSGGSWLTVDGSSGATPRLLQVTADAAQLAPGTYTGTITINPTAALPSTFSVKVSFQVGAAQPPKLVVDKPNLSFAFPQGASQRSSSITVLNAGGGALNFTASASRVTISPARGQALPGKPVSISITADPTGLAPGTYTDTVLIQSDSAGSVSIAVNITVSNLPQALLLTQSGLSFTAVAQGGVIPAQSFGVVNLGTSVVNWTAATSTLSGGSWLSATPVSGASDVAQAAPQVTVSVNASGLAAGSYYGLVSITAPGAANSPQVVTVFLEVLAAGSDPGAVVQPQELVFFTTPAGGPPSSNILQVFNIGATPKTVRTDHSGLAFVSVPNESVLDPNQPTRLIIQPTDTLSKGTYTGSLTLQFSDGRVQSVKLTVISADSLPAPNNGLGKKPAAVGCTPTRLLPTITSLGQSFLVSAGWPVALAADVRDDCGVAHTSGSVSVSFSNGDSPLPLNSLNDGTWQGTWKTSSSSSLANVSITVNAVNPQLNISGSRQIEGGLRSPKDPPVLTSGSVGSAAGFVAYSALAPGGIISIYGDRLADNTATNQSLPLPVQLSDTQVIIAGQAVPLFYVSQNQVNALVPFGVNPNTTQQVLVQRGQTYSQPIPVDVGPAQPAAFLANGNAIVVAYRGTAPGFLVTAASPATAGDVLVIYCAGLGATDQVVVDGAPSPVSPPARTKAAVSVAIGGKAAPVAFAGLTPGFAGLYQINATVPPGVASGNAPLVLTAAGQTGPQSTLPIQ